MTNMSTEYREKCIFRWRHACNFEFYINTFKSSSTTKIAYLKQVVRYLLIYLAYNKNY